MFGQTVVQAEHLTTDGADEARGLGRRLVVHGTQVFGGGVGTGPGIG